MNTQMCPQVSPVGQFAGPAAPQIARARKLKVALVIGPGFSQISLAALGDIFLTANQTSGANCIDVLRVSVTGAPVSTNGGLQFVPNLNLEDLQARLGRSRGLDAVFICCGEDTLGAFSQPLLNLFRSCRRHRVPLYSSGEELSLLLQSGIAGRATPHWSRLARLRENHPDVEISEDLYHFDGQISTCSGRAATLDFAVQFVSDTLGADMAAAVCRQLLISFPRKANQRQVMFDYHRIRNAPEKLRMILETMHENVEDPISLHEISSMFGISLRQIERLFARHLSASPARYYRTIRLEIARQLVEQTDLSQVEISAATGFGSPSNLAKVFKARFGKLPSEFRKMT